MFEVEVEVEKIRPGDGEVFHGEGILAVIMALLQSGVSYVGGCQGAQVSHMMDVLNDARDIMDGIGIHSQRNDVDACVELWGGRVVMGKEELNDKTPVAPIDMTKDLSCPLLGLFGNDDRAPSPEQVNQHEAELKKHGKPCEFHRYDGAGHGFFYWHRPLYRPEAAMDGWSKVFAFFGNHLAK